MILFGMKTEEYREIKPYWIKRIAKEWNLLNEELTIWEKGNEMFKSMPFDRIEFTNGYNPKSPKVILECKGIEIGTGNTKWGAIEHETYFVIKLGSEVSRKNC